MKITTADLRAFLANNVSSLPISALQQDQPMSEYMPITRLAQKLPAMRALLLTVEDQTMTAQDLRFSLLYTMSSDRALAVDSIAKLPAAQAYQAEQRKAKGWQAS